MNQPHPELARESSQRALRYQLLPSSDPNGLSKKDFQTDQDVIDKANFALQQEQRKQAEAAARALKQSDKRRAADGVGLAINLEDSVDK